MKNQIGSQTESKGSSLEEIEINIIGLIQKGEVLSGKVYFNIGLNLIKAQKFCDSNKLSFDKWCSKNIGFSKRKAFYLKKYANLVNEDREKYIGMGFTKTLNAVRQKEKALLENKEKEESSKEGSKNKDSEQVDFEKAYKELKAEFKGTIQKKDKEIIQLSQENEILKAEIEKLKKNKDNKVDGCSSTKNLAEEQANRKLKLMEREMGLFIKKLMAVKDSELNLGFTQLKNHMEEQDYTDEQYDLVVEEVNNARKTRGAIAYTNNTKEVAL